MKKSILFDSHKELSARFIPFAGWQMPFSYQGPTQEHLQTRKNVGLFDVSHMGQIRITGPDSLAFLERLLPSNLESLSPGQSLYSVLCLPTGGLIDDLILHACSKKDYLLCVNSTFKDKDLKWILSQKEKEEVQIQDESSHWALIAVQGPKSLDLCQKIFPAVEVSALSKFHFIEKEGQILSRTGYTGEEGFEIYVPIKQAPSLWRRFLKEGKEFLAVPVGLGARDTLRLEKAYLLAGQDFNENHSPWQAGLGWLIRSPKNYIGKQALEEQKALPSSKLQAFVLHEEKASYAENPRGSAVPVPRTHNPIYSLEGELIGQVTSGAKSPSLNKMIGLAYIKGSHKEFWIETRGLKSKAKRTKKPFLKN